MDTLQKKILCPSILNLSTDNMREEIEKIPDGVYHAFLIYRRHHHRLLSGTAGKTHFCLKCAALRVKYKICIIS